MNPIELAHEYADLLRNRLGSHLRSVVLFGSRARGNAHEGSDYDVLVIVDGRNKEVREATTSVGIEMLDRHEVLFAPLTYDEAEWHEARQFPIGRNIQREGIAV